MLTEASEAVKKRRTASGRGFPNLAAADPAGDLETGSGPVPIAHPIENLGQTDPGLDTVDIGLQGALEAAQRPDQITPLGFDRPLPRPQDRTSACGCQSAGRVELIVRLRSRRALQHRKLLSEPRVSIGSVTKSRMSASMPFCPRQPVSPSSLPSANEGGKEKGIEGN